MRTLVTGASGFIGSRLCRALCTQGHEVIAPHRPTSLLPRLGARPRRGGGRRLIHTSSVAALGVPDAPPSSSAQDAPLLDERHPWNYVPERWPYAFAKHCSELEVLQAAREGMEAVIVNPSAVFGADRKSVV